ncbi:hypothetical protein SFRURICE_017722, partial [Spodoptera frugiperda]
IASLIKWSQVCWARGLGFDSLVGQNIIGPFFEVSKNFSVVARSLKLGPVYGNRLTSFYMGLITYRMKRGTTSNEFSRIA